MRDLPSSLIGSLISGDVNDTRTVSFLPTVELMLTAASNGSITTSYGSVGAISCDQKNSLEQVPKKF